MRLLLTGATGHLGRRLAVRLAGVPELSPRLLVRSPGTGDSDLPGQIQRGDLLDHRSLMEACHGVQVVVHLAGLTRTNRPRLYHRVNVEGTRNLLDACTANGVERLVFASSRTALPSGGAYAESKLEAERLVVASGIPHCTLAIAEVYGGGRDAICRVLDAVAKGRPVPVPWDARCRVAPVHVDDALAVLQTACLGGPWPEKRYTVAGPEEFSFVEMVRRMEAATGRTSLKVPAPLILLRLLALGCSLAGSDAIVRDQVPRLLVAKPSDISAARRDLGFAPRNFEEGIRTLVSSAGWAAKSPAREPGS